MPSRWPLSFVLVILIKRSPAKSINVDWINPSRGDIFYSGEKIIGKWRASEPAESPSFSLCLCADRRPNTSDCGEVVWPSVKHHEGSYSISFDAPNITSTNVYILRMEDSSGFKSDTPAFSLRVNPTSSSSNTTNNIISSQDEDMTQSHLGLNSAHTEVPIETPAPKDTHPSKLKPDTPSETIASNSTPSATSEHSPNTLVAHKPPIAAVYLIPLSVVAAFLVFAVGLLVRRYLKLRKARINDAERLESRRSSIRSHGSGSDWQKTSRVFPMNELEYCPSIPVPLFMPVDAHQEPKRITRKALQNVYTKPSPTRSAATQRPSTRSVLPPQPYLPPIVPSPHGFFDEGVPVTGSVISDYFKLSPPVSPSSLKPIYQGLHEQQQFDYDTSLPRSGGTN